MTVLCWFIFQVQRIIDQEAMDRSVGETENGDAFLDLKKQLASKSPHRYTKVGFVTNEIVIFYKCGEVSNIV